MAYGDKENGTCFLYEVPSTLKNMQDGEFEAIEKLWEREIEKCKYVIEQREEKKEYYAALKVEEEKRKALAEVEKDVNEDTIIQKELE